MGTNAATGRIIARQGKAPRKASRASAAGLEVGVDGVAMIRQTKRVKHGKTETGCQVDSMENKKRNAGAINQP